MWGGHAGEGEGTAHHNRASRNNCSGVYANAYLITTAERSRAHSSKTLLDLMDERSSESRPHRGRNKASKRASSGTRAAALGEGRDGEKAKEITDGFRGWARAGSTRWMENDCARMYVWYNPPPTVFNGGWQCTVRCTCRLMSSSSRV